MLQPPEQQTFKDALRTLLQHLANSRTGPQALTPEEREQLLELTSVLSGIAFERVGESKNMTGTRLAIELTATDGKGPNEYILVVWNTGSVQVIDPHFLVLDLGFSL